jgi:hypothetical protein
MRISVLAILVSTLWLATGRAQESSGSMNNAARPGKTHALPNMPAPKPAGEGEWHWISPHPKRERRDTSLQPFTCALRKRVADRKLWLVAAGVMGSSVLVAAGTGHCRHTAGVGRCIGSDGEFNATQGIQIGLSGLVTGLGYWWKKSDQETYEKHPRWWGFPVTAMAVNTFMALDQFSKRCPRGSLFDGRTCK